MEILVLVILILLNGFFALSEIALVSSKRLSLEKSRLEGSSGAKVALKLLDNSEYFLSAIQVGITLIGIVTGVYGGLNIADDVAPWFQTIEFTKPYADEIAITLTVLIITYFSIVIGELVPKTIALSNPEKIAIAIAPIILYFSRMFYPFVKLLSLSTNYVNRFLGIKKHSGHMTEAELRHIIKNASVEGIIEQEQNIIHDKIFYFSDKKAKHLMTHRTDVEWVDIDKPDNHIFKILSETQHSKVICAKGTLDDFQGILYLRDFYKSFASKDKIVIADLLVQPIIIPENTNAQKVVSLFRENKIHICFVINEYGGFEGIITLHDIIENIIGQIPDEGEAYEPDVFVRDDKSVLVSGEAPIETLAGIIESFKIDFDEIDYSTVAGFVINEINKIPQIGDKFNYLGYKIEIVDIDGNRIDKILISKESGT